MKILHANRVVVGDGQTVYDNGAVVMDGDTIQFVGEFNEAAVLFPDAEVEQKENCTIVPGLIDMHVHLGSYYRRPDAREIEENLGHLTLIAYKNMQDAMSVGITTIRTVGDPKGLGAALRAGFHKGIIKGPRLFTCERPIGITGGHGSHGGDSSLIANSPWEVRAAVRQCFKDGADWIKAMASHREHTCEYTQQEMNAFVDETHKFHRKCAIHAATIPAATMAIEAGFDTIEHGAFITPELAQKAADKGIAWIPTAYVYMAAAKYLTDKIEESGAKPNKLQLREIAYFEESIDAYKTNFLLNYSTGMTVCTGTDIVFPDWHITPIVEELETLCMLGLTPLQALQCATQNPAEVLEREDEFGSLRAGLCADLLVVEGDPTADIGVLRHVKQVYRNGEALVSR